MNYLLQTEKSFLATLEFKEAELIEKCVFDVRNKFIIKPSIFIFGKECKQQRNICFFSDESIGYKYSGNIAKSQSLTKSLKQLISNVNKVCDSDFNGILVNQYSDGSHYIGKHSDNEKSLSKIGVVSISYGSSRIFRIRDKKTGEIVIDVPTKGNELLIMGGDFQKEFTHEVPKQNKIKTERISFTFRKHLE